MEITGLRAQGRPGLVVTDDPEPMLSWKLSLDSAREAPEAYEVATASSREALLGPDANQSITRMISLHEGPRHRFDAGCLPSRSEVWWRVRPVLKNGGRGAWSGAAVFEKGIRDGDWSAGWIRMPPESRQASAPRFRKFFRLDKPVAKARLYVCGLGWHESWLNGEKLGDEVLQPAQTDYEFRCFYVAHDVTARLRQGENVLGFWVGDGFFNQDRVWGPNGMSYGQPMVKAQLEITHPDGGVTVIGTDPSWTCAKSPVIRANVYAGEEFDARAEDPAWASPAGGTEGWMAVEQAKAPGGELIAQDMPPCRRKGDVRAVSARELKPGVWIYDFGVNLVGWAKLSVEAEPGTRLTLRFAEDLLTDGSPNFATGGVEHTGVIQTDSYTCRGSGKETWEPRFTYHGFRHVELTLEGGGLRNGPPRPEMLEGVIVHNDLPVTGRFTCSDPTLNMAFEWAHRTFTGNIQGVPTDCPIRERCGWTGDAHLIVPYSMFRFDAAALWAKYAGDIATSARRDTPMLSFGGSMGERGVKPKAAGIPTMVAPGKRFIGEATPDWGAAIVFIPWDIYLHTGDRRLLERSYGLMRQWTLHLESRATDGILRSGLGDWCRPHPRDSIAPPRDYYAQVVPMLSTACYFRCARIMADTARLLGRADDAARFADMTEKIRTAFLREFYGPESSMTPDQTVHAIAIEWEILPAERRAGAAARLAGLVGKADDHFMTGVFGMPSLWPALVAHGHRETAWRALQNETYPSFKHLAGLGATTFWEVWPGPLEPKPYSRSMNHPFQAAFVQWFYSGLAGIRPDPANPGFRSILLEPQMIGGLSHVDCAFESPMGEIRSVWKREGKLFHWDFMIPAGSSASARVPGRVLDITPNPASVRFTDADDLQGRAQRAMLPAGRYRITSSWP